MAHSRRICEALPPSVRLQREDATAFFLHGAYAEGSSTDSTNVDLCKDKKVNLVE
jgi:hypothetical protein